MNHRNRHGFFTHWEELAEVKEFPMEALDRIKQRATLQCPPDVREGCFGPRRVKPSLTKAIRSTRSADRLKPPA